MAEMSMENPGVTHKNKEGRIETGDQEMAAEKVSAERGCCFWRIPYLGSNNRSSETVGLVSWERIPRTTDNSSEERWWTKGLNAFKKVREWSEIVAGPKWKTFIRRFNKNKNGGGRSGKFQYDPLSYALNFDEGPLENGLLDDDFHYRRDFSSRYAAIPMSAKSSMDLGKDAPSFVG